MPLNDPGSHAVVLDFLDPVKKRATSQHIIFVYFGVGLQVVVKGLPVGGDGDERPVIDYTTILASFKGLVLVYYFIFLARVFGSEAREDGGQGSADFLRLLLGL